MLLYTIFSACSGGKTSGNGCEWWSSGRADLGAAISPTVSPFSSVMRQLQTSALPWRSAQFLPLIGEIGLNTQTRLVPRIQLLEF